MLSPAQESRLINYFEIQSNSLTATVQKFNLLENLQLWLNESNNLLQFIHSIPTNSISLSIPTLLNLSSLTSTALQNYTLTSIIEPEYFWQYFQNLESTWMNLLSYTTTTHRIRLNSIIKDILESLQEYTGITSSNRNNLFQDSINSTSLTMPPILEESVMDCEPILDSNPIQTTLSTELDSDEEEFEEVIPSNSNSEPITLSLGQQSIAPPISVLPEAPPPIQRDFEDPFSRKLDPDAESSDEEEDFEDEIEDEYTLHTREVISKLFHNLIKALEASLS